MKHCFNLEKGYASQLKVPRTSGVASVDTGCVALTMNKGITIDVFSLVMRRRDEHVSPGERLLRRPPGLDCQIKELL